MDKNKFRNKSFLKNGLIVLVTVAVSILTYFGTDISYLIKTSIVGLPEHEPFNGTVYPVQRVPDWVYTDRSQTDAGYDALSENELIDIPYYNPEVLATSTDSLEWGNSEHDKIRNAKITYSVPYMGTYMLDGLEYTGSHLGIDLKLPSGTPIYAIANGVVVKASNQSAGFGHHIVLRHNNSPETIFSSYSHLSEILISAGDVVNKGDQIAFSGNTGTATTPHLHFQIDNENAPWHPFWPFTWQEVADAGLDFFSAVNEGLGQENALATTVHPMNYVQDYLDGVASLTAESYAPAEVVVEEPEEVEVAVVEEVVEEIAEEVVPEVAASEEVEVMEEVTEKVVEEVAAFSDLPGDHAYYDAVTYLVAENVVNGYPDGTFKPEAVVSRVEALKFIYEGLKEALSTGTVPFPDVSIEEWYGQYLYTAYERGVVNGYPDGSFKPTNTVNKAEFYKILFNGMGVDVNPNVETAPFSDVSVDDWFAPYVAYAKELGIIDADVDVLNASDGMSRGEVAYAIYRLMLVVE